ncbi:MAG: enoyl-CoA hydratase/isomerase family protein [Pseudomonadota bacterium]
MENDFQLLRIKRSGRVASVIVDAPPVNVITMPLFAELDRATALLKSDADLNVIVFKSANPDFFLAHFDVSAILERPVHFDPQRDAQMKPFHVMCERVRTMSKVTIAQIEGRVGGGGSEFAAAMDMRFGVRGRTVINQMEVPLGILPGGTGTQRLPRLLGRGRALELILGADDLDGETAERWGYLNRVLEPDQIDAFVSRLAARIASFPVEAVRLAKESVNNAERPWLEGIYEEAYLFERLLRTPEARRNMQKFLELGGQTRDAELRMGDLNAELGDGIADEPV